MKPEEILTPEGIKSLSDIGLLRELARCERGEANAHTPRARDHFMECVAMIRAEQIARAKVSSGSTTASRWQSADQDPPDADETVLGYSAETECYYLVARDDRDGYLDAETGQERVITHWQRLDGPLSPPEEGR